MVAPTTLFVALKALSVIFACIMAATLIYLFTADLSVSCFDPSAWWMRVLETDVIIYFAYVGVWFFYKESSWIKTIVFASLLFCCGSFVTCGYIALQFFKLSPEESSKDPFYFVLGYHGTHKTTFCLALKVIVAVLGCCMLGILIYAFLVDGTPFHMEVLTPCMITALVDLYIHVVVFSIWIAYKESSSISAVIWILSLLCFGSMAQCIYVLRQLFNLSPQQPVSLILFNQSNRDLIMLSDPLLTEHSINV